MTKNDHRVVIWARGAKGVPVSCGCGWKVYATTIMGAYRAKREHLEGSS